jgi:ADP-ribose pyrophosphatase YjhB (NUDIX family)
LAVRLLAPKNRVGAVGVIFNDAGEILMVEHVFRPDFAWGLPGGWVEQGEDPADAVERELHEELNLAITVKKLLLCQPQGLNKDLTTPLGLGLAYYCRANGSQTELQQRAQQAASAFEILSVRWVAPDKIEWPLEPLQHEAIVLGRREFENEHTQNN